MIRMTTAVATTALLTATSAVAGGVERIVPSVGFLYEQGNYAEFSFARVSPKVSGQTVAVPPTIPAGLQSGDISPAYWQSSLALKLALSDKVDVGFVIDQPIGADTAYPTGIYPFTGATASLEGTEVRAIVKYQATDNVSVFGGLRNQTASGVAHIPTAGGGTGYRLNAGTSSQNGYLVGAAYERKEIALRVALSYYSEMSHTFRNVQEGTNAGPAPSLPFTTVIPEAIRLDVQSGIAPGTLAFGSIHYVPWSRFDITPVGFAASTGGSSLVDLDDDVFTYTLGVGRALNEQLSVSASVTYEKTNGGFSGNLNPTDGRTAIGIGARYKLNDAVTISGGVNYSWLGDAQTQAPFPAPTGTQLSNFTDNTSIAAGLKIGINF